MAVFLVACSLGFSRMIRSAAAAATPPGKTKRFAANAGPRASSRRSRHPGVAIGGKVIGHGHSRRP